MVVVGAGHIQTPLVCCHSGLDPSPQRGAGGLVIVVGDAVVVASAVVSVEVVVAEAVVV